MPENIVMYILIYKFLMGLGHLKKKMKDIGIPTVNTVYKYVDYLDNC